MFLRNRDIFLHVHSTVLKIIKKLSDFANCPNNALYSRRKSQIMPFILLSYPFRVLNLEQFLWLVFVFLAFFWGEGGLLRL